MSVSNDPTSNTQAQASTPAELTAIDLEELAQEVVDLLLQELEIENDRTGKS